MGARCQWIARAAEEDLGTSELAAQHSLKTMWNTPGGEMDSWDSVNRRALTQRKPSVKHWRKSHLLGEKIPLARERLHQCWQLTCFL